MMGEGVRVWVGEICEKSNHRTVLLAVRFGAGVWTGIVDRL